MSRGDGEGESSSSGDGGSELGAFERWGGAWSSGLGLGLELEDIDGIPCNHTIGAISCRLRDPYDFVKDWFKTSTYHATYNDYVPPTRSKEHWPEIPSNVIPPRPPNVRIQPGRRKVAQRESISNGLIKKQCGNCQRWGHNKRSCKNPPLARANQPHATTSAVAPQETAKNSPPIF
uniref:CCHC-type domain-containing protein n=1 Tax=Ananas comosus var. bracteatus TaxID=296719 RepID=A0A6V7QBR9_ANACO|nr:unnamed protein product [Ananas comosus var. bracteatus]